YPAREAADVAIVDARTAGIGGVPERRRDGIVETVDDRFVDPQIPERPVEPHLVPNDGTADPGVEVVVLRQLADVRQEVVRPVEGRVARQVGPRARLAEPRRPAVVGRPTGGGVVPT